MPWITGDVSGSQTLTGLDHLYETHINELRVAIDAANAAIGLKAADSVVVHNTGAETIAGVKTFSSAPVVPSAAFPQAATVNLVSDLAAKALDSAVVHNTGAETVAGVKTFSSIPVVPTNSFPESAVINLVADLSAKAVDSAVVHNTGAETIAGAKTFSSAISGSPATGHKLGRTTSLGDETLVVARSTGEGDPTVNAGTIAIFQNNSASGFSGQVDIVTGTAGSASLGFGDKDNPAQGILTWSNVTNSFSLGGGLLSLSGLPTSALHAATKSYVDKLTSFVVGPAGSGATYETDGTADQVQFQAANDAANAQGGGRVYVLKGDYNFSGVLSLSNKVTLVGEALGAVKIVLGDTANITITGKSKVNIFNIETDGDTQPGEPTANFAVHVVDSSDVRIDNCNFMNCGSFGVFINATATNTTQRVWVTRCRLSGKGNNDVIGGGPQNSTNSTVKDIFVLDNYVVQDTSLGVPAGGGTYSNAIDLVKVESVTFAGNKVLGNIFYGNEQWPHKYSRIQGNDVAPAVGQTTCYIGIDTLTGATDNAITLAVQNNILRKGFIWLIGQSTASLLNVSVTGNTIRGEGGVDWGIRCDYAGLCNISDNIINGVTTGITLTNSSSNNLVGNQFSSCTTAILESSSGGNNYAATFIGSSVGTIYSGLAATSSTSGTYGATDYDITAGGSNRSVVITPSGTGKLDVASNIIRLRTAKTPSSATDTGAQGDICWDASYVYVCTATNTWKRVAIATW